MNRPTNIQSENLSAKVSRSAFWVFLFQILDNILGFVRLLILARILTPNDFGLIAIAWLILQILSAFTQTGIHQVLIHKPKVDHYLNTAWTYLFFRGILLFSILFFSAPLLGGFFNAPNSIDIIKAISFTLLFDGLSSIGVIYFQKDFTFNKQFIQQISANFVDFIVSITLALLFKDVWALVYGSLANSLTKLLLSYILTTYRPKFEFNWQIFKELNNYGKWIAGSNFLQFVYSQGDDLLVGRVLGPTSLGFYQLAYRISNLPATQITHLISSVMFPAYASIQKDKRRISKIYLRVLQLTANLSIFVGSLIIFFAFDFTKLFLGEKWIPMVPVMQVLAIWGTLRSISATTGPVWNAMGTPMIVTKIQLLFVIILLILIYPFTINWNITGTSWAVVLASLIPNALGIFMISRSTNCTLNQINKEIVLPLLVALISSIIVGIFTNLIEISNILILIMFGIFYLTTYLFTLCIVDNLIKANIITNTVNLIKSLPMLKSSILYLRKIYENTGLSKR